MVDFPQWNQPFAIVHMEPGYGPQQRFQVVVLRVAENMIQGAPFQHPAVIHHHDFVGDIGDHAQIVGDHQHCHAKLGLKIVH